MYRYSIIIPIYNAERTLERCLDSLLVQNCKEAEIVLVNDGSTDKSRDLCIKYAQKYTQINYINQKNSGVSVARNKGIIAARGQYILFVDSDDYVANNYFFEIDRLLKIHDADLIIFSRYDCMGDRVKEIKYSPFFSYNIAEIDKKLSDLICKKIINGPVTKIYKKSIIDEYQIKFPINASIGEDRAFNIKYSLYIKSLQVDNTPIYFCSLDNENSLSRRKKEKFQEQSQVIRKDIYFELLNSQSFEVRKRHIINALNFGECRVVYTYAKMSWQAKESRSERIKKIKELCKEINSHNYIYPKTKYCQLITLPVRLELVWLIDVIAWKLTH